MWRVNVVVFVHCYRSLRICQVRHWVSKDIPHYIDNPDWVLAEIVQVDVKPGAAASGCTYCTITVAQLWAARVIFQGIWDTWWSHVPLEVDAAGWRRVSVKWLLPPFGQSPQRASPTSWTAPLRAAASTGWDSCGWDSPWTTSAPSAWSSWGGWASGHPVENQPTYIAVVPEKGKGKGKGIFVPGTGSGAVGYWQWM